MEVPVQRCENQECQHAKTGEDGCPSSEIKFALPAPFCSIWSLNGLDDAHLY